MTEKEIRRLNRAELLEILVDQQKEIDRLNEELDNMRKALEDKHIAAETAGSLAEASLALTNIFEEAQKAADLYLYNIFAMGKDCLGEGTPEKEKEPADDLAQKE